MTRSNTRPVALVAFGGNALLPSGDDGTQEQQFARARQAARWLIKVIEQGYSLVIVHGNGPQVGNLLIQAEEASTKIPPQSLDVAVAQTEGSIGFMLQQAMRGQLERSGLEPEVVTILTEVEVDLNDPAFRHPSKPIGPFFSRYRAEALARDYGWNIREDSGRGWRKVVPSPRPVSILGHELIRDLTERCSAVIAAGGGGIPVFRGRDRQWRGVEAVIDKDFSSALLATQLEASLYVNLTAVPRVSIDYGSPDARQIRRMTVDDARRYLDEEQFPAGSMGPKIAAATEYSDATGRDVLITDIDSVEKALEGEDGTRIGPGELTFYDEPAP